MRNRIPGYLIGKNLSQLIVLLHADKQVLDSGIELTEEQEFDYRQRIQTIQNQVDLLRQRQEK